MCVCLGMNVDSSGIVLMCVSVWMQMYLCVYGLVGCCVYRCVCIYWGVDVDSYSNKSCGALYVKG